MFARVFAGAAVMLAGCSQSVAHPANDAQAARSIERPDMRSICDGQTDWSAPGPPVRVFGNVYHVGTCTITVLLVTSDEGHILIDAAPEAAAPGILANIRELGFDPHDVRWILSSHEHWDHAGGLAALKEATGAQLAANAAEVGALESGRPFPDDPQATWLEPIAPVEVDRVLHDADLVSLGPLRLTMHATPAHAPGSTSWTWRSCEGAICHTVVYADSVSAPAPDGYRFTDHPDHVERFRANVARIGALPCDILLTPHPGQSAMYDRYAGDEPLVDPEGCRAYADEGLRAMDRRLAREADGE